MCERILAQNCQKFDNFNFEFSMSHHNAHYQSYKNAPVDVITVAMALTPEKVMKLHCSYIDLCVYVYVTHGIFIF